MNEVCFEILARTPIPQLPPKLPSSPLSPREGHLRTVKKGRGVLPAAWNPYPFPDTIETPFQTNSIYPVVDKQYMLSQLT